MALARSRGRQDSDFSDGVMTSGNGGVRNVPRPSMLTGTSISHRPGGRAYPRRVAVDAVPTSECDYLIWPHRDYLFWPHSASGIGGVRVH